MSVMTLVLLILFVLVVVGLVALPNWKAAQGFGPFPVLAGIILAVILVVLLLQTVR